MRRSFRHMEFSFDSPVENVSLKFQNFLAQSSFSQNFRKTKWFKVLFCWTSILTFPHNYVDEFFHQGLSWQGFVCEWILERKIINTFCSVWILTRRKSQTCRSLFLNSCYFKTTSLTSSTNGPTKSSLFEEVYSANDLIFLFSQNRDSAKTAKTNAIDLDTSC